MVNLDPLEFKQPELPFLWLCKKGIFEKYGLKENNLSNMSFQVQQML